jgi:hypothetical protein
MTGGPVKVDPTKLAIGKLQAALLALGVAATSATVALQVPHSAATVPVPDISCRFNGAGTLLVTEGREGTTNVTQRGDTVFYVPLRGSAERLLLDSTAVLFPGDSVQAAAVCMRQGSVAVPVKPSY